MTSKKKKKGVTTRSRASKKPTPENPPVKSQQTFDAKFTKTELVHLRDLFGIYLPPDGGETVSASLAKAEGRVIAERVLFEKIVELCKRAKLPIEEAAPDYIVGLSQNPVLGVFQMTRDDEGTQEEQDAVENFDDDDDDHVTSFFVNDDEEE